MNNRNSRNHAENVKRYQRSKKKIYPVMVDVNEDQDIIEWFSKQKNYSGAIRTMIRDSLTRRERTNRSIADLRARRRSEGLCIYCNEKDGRTLSGKACCEKCFQKMRERNGAKV